MQKFIFAREFYHFLVSDLNLNVRAAGLFDGNDFTADMVISIGGDGTFLKAAKVVGNKSIPILGINYRTFRFFGRCIPRRDGKCYRRNIYRPLFCRRAKCITANIW